MAGDNKVSNLPSLQTVKDDNLLLVIDSVDDVFTSKNVTISKLFGEIPANSNFLADVTVSGNTVFSGSNTVFEGHAEFLDTVNVDVANLGTVTIQGPITPFASNSSGFAVNQIFWDSNYIYVQVAPGIIKRAQLNSF